MTYLTSRGDVASDKVVLFGRSLGGAVAAALASRPHMHRKIAAVILENTFTSIPDMARLFFPISRFLPNFFFRSCFLTSERVSCKKQERKRERDRERREGGRNKMIERERGGREGERKCASVCVCVCVCACV